MGFSPEPQTHPTCKNEMVPFAFGENKVLGFITRLMVLSRVQPQNLFSSPHPCHFAAIWRED